MGQIHIKTPLLLPDLPDENDKCITRLINTLQLEAGIEKVHVSKDINNGVSELCFHYNPEKISIDRITFLAKQTKASITKKLPSILLGKKP